MKVLFLDVDGVLNNKDTVKKGVHFPIDPYCAFLVGKIQLETDCKVVLSSAWRHLEDGYKEINDRVVPLYDKTGSCCTGIRGAEIHAWIRNNIPYEDRDALRYAILDDEDDMLLWQRDNFFQTSFEYGGLNEATANKVIEHLNKTQ